MPSRNTRRATAAFGAVALLFATSTATAQRRAQVAPVPREASNPDVELVLDDVPLAEAVTGIAARTGYDYIFEPPLPGRVTVAVPARVSPEEANEILHATLLLKGFVALPIAERRYKIVRWEKMSGGAPFTEEELHGERARSVTTRIALRYADPELVARSLKPLLQSGGQIIPFAASGSLILAGSENRIHRLIEVAEQLDAAQHEELMVRRVRYKDASDLKSQLDALTQPKAVRNKFATEVKIELDERTNSLLVSGSPSQLQKLREWIDLIDLPARGEGRLQVIPVYHQDPAEFARLLNELGRGSRTITAGGNVDAGPLVGRDYSVVPHLPTHSLVIRADRGTFEILGQLIAALDREPRMVHIEAVFLEILTDGTLGFGAGGVVPAIKPKEQDDLGLAFLPNVQLSPNTIPGFLEPNQAIDALGGRVFSVVGENLVIPVLDPEGNATFDAAGNPRVITAPGVGISLLAVDRAIEASVKNRPSMLVAVGEEGKVFVGDEIPIPVGSTNIEDLVTLGPSLRVDIQRENVGTEITVSPRYHEGGDILVDLAVELSLVRPDVEIDLETGPVLSNRKVEGTFRAAPSQRTLVAGLESETKGSVRTGIPFLSAIPFLGQFFSVDIATNRRDYLVIAITADLVPTQEEKRARDIALAAVIAERESEFAELVGSRYAVRAASYYKADVARAARDDLDLDDRPTRIIERETADGTRFDLFVLDLDTLTEVARVALALEMAGLAPEIIPLGEVLASVSASTETTAGATTP
ncbi:MAG: secretin N-terminal domain-containing protein [Myxococcota bacterium]|nr:secretin N-terminal domain-containing protein [Myxococcota bacterium]